MEREREGKVPNLFGTLTRITFNWQSFFSLTLLKLSKIICY
jgi:hypothetical protein